MNLRKKRKYKPPFQGRESLVPGARNTHTEKLSSAGLGTATSSGLPSMRTQPGAPAFQPRVLRKSDIEKKVCPKSALRGSRVVQVEIIAQSREKKSFDSASQTNAR